MTDFTKLITTISNQPGDIRTVGVDFFQNNNGQFDEIKKLWQGIYSSRSVEWINYYPSTHFDFSIVEEFSKILELNHIRSWISKVNPGKHAPWHYDADDEEEEYLKLSNGNIIRYSCFVSQPQPGHAFILEDKCYYMQPQGTTVLWPSYKSWHAGTNCGLTPKYMFHFLGYK
jgi:hypothetical protein